MPIDKDRVKGSGKKMSGTLKETAGKALGDSKTEAEGKIEKTEGRVQNMIGGIKDKLREMAGRKPTKK